VTNDVWIFNLNNNKWRRGPALPVAGAAGGAALVNNKVHWFGGLDTNASCDVNNHFVYDLGKPGAGWKDITAQAGMPTPRNHFSTAVVNGIIYAMGGQFGHDACPGKRTNDTPLVHAFNPKTNQWSKKADMPNKNSHSEPGTFVYKGDIYTTGGENAKNKVWKYNPRTNKWSTFRILAEDFVAPIARIIDGDLIVAGGGAPIAQAATDRVRSLRVDNKPPKPVVQPPAPGSNTPEGDTLISMEAEYFDVSTKTDTHEWVHVVLGDSSNADAMITTPDQGELAGSAEGTPMLSYMVNFNYPGKHYIWVRGLGDSDVSGVGNSDSIQVGINGEIASTAYRIDQFPNEWTWSRHTPSNPVATLNVVNAGVNMINFWMREDGLAFDKFVITNDPNYVPTGTGPELSDGSDDYVAPVIEEEIVIDDSVEENESSEQGTVDAENETETNTETNTNEGSDNDSDNQTTTNENDVMPTTDEAVSAISLEDSGSSGGLFGGSASNTMLLSLLLVLFGRRAGFSLSRKIA